MVSPFSQLFWHSGPFIPLPPHSLHISPERLAVRIKSILELIDFGANVFDREIVLCTNLIILFLLFFLEVKHCLTFSDAVNFHPQRRRSGI